MIGFIGGGNMAGALIKGLVDKGRREIVVSEPLAARRAELARSFRVEAVSSNAEVMSKARVVVLAIKPQQMASVLDEIAPMVTETHTIVSIAAGITIAFIRERLKTSRIVRVMPNVGSMVQEGMAVLSLCECLSDSDVNTVKDIFMSSGQALVMPERQLDAVTALSGSGPGFLARILGLMIEAGEGLGLDPLHARQMGVQTLLGTARLLDTGIPPDELVRMVKSPGGTTEAGLNSMSEAGIEAIIKGALEAAYGRAGELSR